MKSQQYGPEKSLTKYLDTSHGCSYFNTLIVFHWLSSSVLIFFPSNPALLPTGGKIQTQGKSVTFMSLECVEGQEDEHTSTAKKYSFM